MITAPSLKIEVDLGGTRLRAVLMDHTGHIFQHCSVATATDPYEEIVLHAMTLQGWVNVPLRALLEERIGLPVTLTMPMQPH